MAELDSRLARAIRAAGLFCRPTPMKCSVADWIGLSMS